MISRLFILTAVAAFSMVPAAATTALQVNQNYSTGYNGNMAIGAGAPDPYFSLDSFDVTLTSPNPVVASPIPGAWYNPVANETAAQWISPTENQTYPAPPVEGDPSGTYDYDAQLVTTFLVPANIGTQVTVTGAFAADNDVTLDIGGTPVMSLNAPAYGSLTPFTYTFTIYGGTRSTSVEFVVNNLDDTGGTVNPTGLIVSNLRFSTAAPEPSTWALLFVSLGSLLMVKRVRHAVSL
jgi:hypothetical protein